MIYLGFGLETKLFSIKKKVKKMFLCAKIGLFWFV